MLHATLHCPNAHHVDLDRLFTGLLKHQRHRETVTFFQRLVQAYKHDVVTAGLEHYLATGKYIDTLTWRIRITPFSFRCVCSSVFADTLAETPTILSISLPVFFAVK